MMDVLCVVTLYPTCQPFARHMRHRSVPLARSVDHHVAIPLMELSKFRLFWPSRVCRVEWRAPRPEESENESKPSSSASFEPPTRTPHSNATSSQPTSDDFTQAMNRVLLFLRPHIAVYHSF
jgi:hypothetical protein